MPYLPDLGPGLGLRLEYIREILSGRSSARWFEALTENYLKDGGRPLAWLDEVRRDYPIALHGVSMNLGSTDPLDRNYLKRLKALASRIEPFTISDHLCWTGAQGRNLHDLLPLPYTREAVRHVSARIAAVQDFLGRPILIENLSSYLTYKSSEMAEWEFLSEISRASGCGILLDVNNIYVSAVNHGFDPIDYLEGIPIESVGQIHLAGHTRRDLGEGQAFLIDTHDEPVCEEVWELFGKSVARFGKVSAMVERDDHFPEFSELESEVRTIAEIRDRQSRKREGRKDERHFAQHASKEAHPSAH